MIYVKRNGVDVARGSGFAYGDYIITAKHVTDAGDSFVVFPDGSNNGFYTSLVPVDSNLDVSVLKISKELPSVTLCNSDSLKEGEKLVSITSPKGVQNTIDECFYNGIANYGNGNYLQISESNTDNGSSGGAVFDTSGELVGMVIKGASVGNSALIPINELKPILEQLK